MHNQGVFNPAYFNSQSDLTATMYYRNQWVGIEGAPVTKSLVAGISLQDKHNININLYQDRITIFEDTKFGLGYNYRLKLSRYSKLSFGIKGDYGIFSADYLSLDLKHDDDPAFSENTVAQGYLNIGSGIYFESKKFFAGISMPYLFNNSFTNVTQIFNPNLIFNHTYLTVGHKFESTDVTFTPTALVKIVSGTPLQAEVNANVLLKDKIWTSLGYRTDHSIVGSIGYVFPMDIKLVYSYDLAIFSAANHSIGTHEISLGYGLAFYKKNSFQRRKYLKRNGSPKRKN